METDIGSTENGLFNFVKSGCYAGLVEINLSGDARQTKITDIIVGRRTLKIRVAYFVNVKAIDHRDRIAVEVTAQDKIENWVKVNPTAERKLLDKADTNDNSETLE